MPEFDWRSPDAYRPIQDITAPGFAWEFLRRSPDYRRDVKRHIRRPSNLSRADDAFVRHWGLPFRGGPPPFRDRSAGGFLSDPRRPIETTLQAMMTTRHLGETPHPVVASAARELLNKSENERSGVLSTAMSFLGLYRDPVVAEVTSRCDWRIADLVEGARPVTLYLVVPPSDISRTKPLVRLILNQVGRRLTEELEGKRRRHKLLLMLDEFPALGRLDFFESALAFMADEAGAHFESSYFLTLCWLPPAEDAARAEAWLYEGRDKRGADGREQLAGFVDRTDRVLNLVDGFMPETEWLSDAATLTYLHATVSTRHHKVRVPETPMHLDAILVDEPLTGGLEPRLGNAHLRTLTVMGFPTQTWPGLLDDLNRLAFPYRWVTRAICMDKTEATKVLGRIRRQWFAKRKSIAAILKEVMTNEASALMDSDASNKAADADLALQELGSDLVGTAYVTATVTVWDESARIADERLRLVEKVIQGRDFTAMTERVNAVEAWLGSLPGHVYANVRQPPISTLNLAHMMPFSAVWAGPERDEHFAAAPLFVAKTEGSTPFRFALHVGDVGHTLVVGPTGAGKSVLLALMALQFRRYEDAQVFAFDFGGSIRAAALAMGGDWHDLGGSLGDDAAEPVALQPLAAIDAADERAWAAEWVAAILGREKVVVTPDVKELLWSALANLASAPVQERTLTGLSVLLQSQTLKQALKPYCVGGPWGRLLDTEAERIGDADVQAFETEGLIGTGAAAPVLAYLFHRIEDRLDGRPTLLIVDEGWLALDDEGFAGQMREWLKTLRKKNASVIFATQSLADIDGSAIAPAIIESCPTRLFLPNERALEPQIASIYRRFGLNDRQIEILSRATPKRDYYCQSRRGNRLFELGLGEVALAFTAASSKSDQALIARLVAEHGRAGFARAWLEARGVAWATDLITDPQPQPETVR